MVDCAHRNFIQGSCREQTEFGKCLWFFEMHEIANLIDRVLSNPTDDMNLFSVKPDVKALCERFPFYSELLETL